MKKCPGCTLLGKTCAKCRYPLNGTNCITCDTLGKVCQKCKYPGNDSVKYIECWTDKVVYTGHIGWVCPLCTIVNSPFVKTCPCTPYQPKGN